MMLFILVIVNVICWTPWQAYVFIYTIIDTRTDCQKPPCPYPEVWSENNWLLLRAHSKCVLKCIKVFNANLHSIVKLQVFYTIGFGNPMNFIFCRQSKTYRSLWMTSNFSSYSLTPPSTHWSMVTGTSTCAGHLGSLFPVSSVAAIQNMSSQGNTEAMVFS